MDGVMVVSAGVNGVGKMMSSWTTVGDAELYEGLTIYIGMPVATC